MSFGLWALEFKESCWLLCTGFGFWVQVCGVYGLGVSRVLGSESVVRVHC